MPYFGIYGLEAQVYSRKLDMHVLATTVFVCEIQLHSFMHFILVELKFCGLIKIKVSVIMNFLISVY